MAEPQANHCIGQSSPLVVERGSSHHLYLHLLKPIPARICAHPVVPVRYHFHHEQCSVTVSASAFRALRTGVVQAWEVAAPFIATTSVSCSLVVFRHLCPPSDSASDTDSGVGGHAIPSPSSQSDSCSSSLSSPPCNARDITHSYSFPKHHAPAVGEVSGKLKNCWISPDPQTIFSVRSSSYLKDKTKAPTQPAVFEMVECDFFDNPSGVTHIVQNMPNNRVQRAALAEDGRFYVVIVLKCPSAPYSTIVLYLAAPLHLRTPGFPAPLEGLPRRPIDDVEIDEQFQQAWQRFVDGSDDYKAARWKVCLLACTTSTSLMTRARYRTVCAHAAPCTDIIFVQPSTLLSTSLFLTHLSLVLPAFLPLSLHYRLFLLLPRPICSSNRPFARSQRL